MLQGETRYMWMSTCLLDSFSGVTSTAAFALRMQYGKSSPMAPTLEMSSQLG